MCGCSTWSDYRGVIVIHQQMGMIRASQESLMRPSATILILDNHQSSYHPKCRRRRTIKSAVKNTKYSETILLNVPLRTYTKHVDCGSNCSPYTPSTTDNLHSIILCKITPLLAAIPINGQMCDLCTCRLASVTGAYADLMQVKTSVRSTLGLP